MTDDLAARVRRLELVERAKAVTVEYGRACDRKDVEALRTEVFNDDVVLRLPGRDVRGPDDVAAFYAGAFAAEPGTRRHFVTNQLSSIDEADRVTVESYFLFLSADATSVIGWGAYRDVVVVHDDAARIADKTIVLDVRTDLAAGWAMDAPDMNRRLDGKVAVVTGGASGIGAATVRRFVDEGAGVVIADVLEDEGEALADELGEAVRFARVDVTSEADVRAAVELAVSELGRLDVMFNNAGIIGAVGSIAKLDLADVDRTLSVIVRGTVIGMKCAAAVMIDQGSGVILSTSSPAGVVGGVGPHVYSAAKAAVLGLTRSVAAELRPHRIRVNAIVPGATVTAMTAEILTGDAADIGGAEARLSANALLERPAQPSDIAAGAAYLASDEAWFITGQVLTIDGGLTTISGPSPMAIGEFAEPRALLGPAGHR